MTQPLIRPARHEDIPKILKLEKAAWGDRGAAAREMIEARLETFPEGNLIAILGDEIAAFVSTLIAKDYDIDNPIATWQEATGQGYIKSRHNPEGETLYGVNLSVDPSFRDTRLGSLLGATCIKWNVVNKNRLRTVLGGRMTGYGQYREAMDPETYLKKVVEGEIVDHSIQFFLDLECEEERFKAHRVLPNHFPDPDSMNNGVLMVWKNPKIKD